MRSLRSPRISEGSAPDWSLRSFATQPASSPARPSRGLFAGHDVRKIHIHVYSSSHPISRPGLGTGSGGPPTVIGQIGVRLPALHDQHNGQAWSRVRRIAVDALADSDSRPFTD